MREATRGIQVTIARHADEPRIIAAFSAFRKKLFVDKFGWDLPAPGDHEQDEFDRPSTEYCIMSSGGRIVGGLRAIRTDYEYLACKIFPQLASLRDYPRRHDVWEISRFGVLSDAHGHELARVNYGLMFRFAKARHATALVALADLAYERYLRTLGIRTRRYGPPKKIGSDRAGRDLICVAGEIPMADQAPERIADLLDLTAHLEINDALAIRPEAIPA
jgi:N-acyl-L-homoserine lactone synthetase